MYFSKSFGMSLSEISNELSFFSFFYFPSLSNSRPERRVILDLFTKGLADSSYDSS